MSEQIYYFELGDLLGIGMTFVVLGIGLAYGLSVMSDIKDDFVTDNTGWHCAQNSTNGTGNTLLYDGCGSEYNASNASIEAISKIPSKLGLIVTVVLAAVIIGILVRYLFVRFN